MNKKTLQEHILSVKEDIDQVWNEGSKWFARSKATNDKGERIPVVVGEGANLTAALEDLKKKLNHEEV